MKASGYCTRVAALLAVGMVSTSAAGADIVLKAATANPATKPEVRLRWTVTEGWFADGQAFNVYRVEGAKKTKLNPAPIKPVEPAAPDPKNPRLDVKALMVTARLRPAGIADRDLFRFNPPLARPAPSTPVFMALKTQIQTLRQVKGPALPPIQLNQAISSQPAVRLYMSNFAGLARKPAALTQAQLIQQARSTLIYGAFTNAALGKQLGMAFDDLQVTAGAHYQYELRSVAANGQEAPAPVATADVTVGADAQPPVPTGVIGLQRDADAVSLRWDRPTPDQETALGMVSYNIRRTAPGAAQLLNKNAVVIGALATQAGHVEPISFFTDPDAPVGPITYQVTLVDMFGRESQPGSLAFTMEDWHTPGAITHTQADYHLGRAVVAWTASNEAGVQYRVYRVDTEIPGSAPQLMTANPVAGDPYVPDTGNHRRIIVAKASSLTAYTALSKAFIAQPVVAPGAVAIQPFRSHQRIQPKVPVWLQYVDANPPKDHYYRYIVTALYTRNTRDSVGAQTSIIPVPQDAKPTSPANLKSSFAALRSASAVQPSRQRVAGDTDSRPNHFITAGLAGAACAVPVQQFKAKSLLEKREAFPLTSTIQDRLRLAIRGQAKDGGGQVTLSWDPVAGAAPVSYRVYRSNGGGYMPAGGAILARPVDLAILDAIRITPAAKQFKAGGFLALDRKLAVRQAPAVSVGAKSFTYVTKFPREFVPQYALLATVINKASFTETVSKSHAQYYNYRVIAVNRWGIVGDPADLAVRVPATLSPSVPSIMAAFPVETGGVEVQVRPNAAEEEVTKYHVLRKAVPVKRTYTTLVQAANSMVVLPGANAAPAKPPVGVLATRAHVGGVSAAGPGSTAATFQLKTAPMVKMDANIGGRSLIAAGAVADKIGPGAARFGILRSNSAFSALATRSVDGKSFVLSQELIALLDTVGYQDVGVIDATKADGSGLVKYVDQTGDPRTEYAYRVVAEDSDTLRSAASSILDAAAFKVKADPPANVAIAFSAGAARLTWGLAKDAAGYIVQRSSDGTHFTQISGIQKEMSYNDFSTIPGRAYTYRVLALDSAGNLSDPADKPFTAPAQ